MKTVDITFHLPENSLEAEAALKSMEMAGVLNTFLTKVYSSGDKDYDFWDRVSDEVEEMLREKGIFELIQYLEDDKN